MKHTRLLPLLLILTGAFAACSINVPWEVMDDYDGVRVVMHVVPDDADVRLNGRLIGAAYEYASPGLALRLASRENTLEFRQKGFRRKVVDLRDYATRTITVKISLEPEGDAAAGETAEDREAYAAKSEPLPPQPAEKPAPAETRFLTLVALTVVPEETAVYIDGRFWGLAPAEKKAIFLRLPPGQYTFSAFKPGYAPFSKGITVPKQEKFELEINLQK